jgi:FlgD Ig-like domain
MNPMNSTPGLRSLRPSAFVVLMAVVCVASDPFGGEQLVSTATAAESAGVPGAFLRYGSSARGLALGNAMTAIADDAASSYWNPAGYARLRTMELTAMSATLFEDTQYNFFTLGLPTQKHGSFALNGAFLSSGSFERATLFEDLGESFNESSSFLGLAYAYKIGRLTWGVNLKTVSQQLAGAKGAGFGADVGVYMRPHRTLSMGFSLQNALAPEITLDEGAEKFARTMRAGTALHLFRNRLVVSTDLVRTENMEANLRSGIEMWPTRQFALRTGYDAVREQTGFGAGFRWENWQLDYTYLDHDLGGTQVVSATFRFGVPYGVKMQRDRSLFSPSGETRSVNFGIETAVTGKVESWQLEILDREGNVVRTLSGNGAPPDGVEWRGDDDQGRLVADGSYNVRITILDEMREEWEYTSSVEVLGFADRTRAPIRVEISGSGDDKNNGGKQQ